MNFECDRYYSKKSNNHERDIPNIGPEVSIVTPEAGLNQILEISSNKIDIQVYLQHSIIAVVDETEIISVDSVSTNVNVADNKDMSADLSQYFPCSSRHKEYNHLF